MDDKIIEGGVIMQFSKKVKNILNAYGNVLIVDAIATRTPIWNSLKKILYLVSKGEALKAHDEYFHTSIIFKLENGKSVLVEKNALPNMEVDNFPEITKETQYRQVPNVKNKKLTLNQVIKNTLLLMGNDKFFKYRPLEENCQNFLVNILHANNLLTKSLYDFIMQDMKTIIESVPGWAKKISNVFFDIANYLTYFKGGKK